MKTIAIVAGTISGNRGAETMVTTVIGKIREKHHDAKFLLYSYYPKEDKLLVEDEGITVFSLTPLAIVFRIVPCSILFYLFKILGMQKLGNKIIPLAVLRLSQASLLVDVAGVSFVAGREKFLPFNILTLFPALLFKIPVIKISQALGPFNGLLTRVCARLILPRCRKIFARGKITLSHLSEFDEKRDYYELACDIGFLYEPQYSLSNENYSYIEEIKTDIVTNCKAQGNKLIGICPSSLIASQAEKSNIDYLSMLSMLIKKLSDSGFAVVVFPNATRQHSSKGRNNDLVVIWKLKAMLENRLSTDNLFFIEKDINTSGIKSIITLCDVAMVSRFHAMVAALTLSVPVIVLGWSHKYIEVMQEFSMEKFVLDYKDSRVDNLYSKINTLLERRGEFSLSISESLVEVKASAARQFNYIQSLLK